MKIVIVGGNGTIGSAVTTALGDKHEIIKVGKSKGDYTMDIADLGSIRSTLARIGKIDAIISAAGDIAFNLFTEMSQDEWQLGINSKLMGQINLTREALQYLTPKGSVTLTTGVLSTEFIAAGISASTLNGALEHFVRSAATELPNGIRINAVSPSVLEESMSIYGDFFPGFIPVPGARVAQAYVRSVLGVINGEVLAVV